MNDQELVDVNFELEQDILKCWNVVDDIREVLEDLEAGHFSQAEAVQALQSFANVYQNRFDRTFRRYETVCRGLHELRQTVKGFEFAQNINPKVGKKSKSKKAKPVDQ
jgi:hypothetical protein